MTASRTLTMGIAATSLWLLAACGQSNESTDSNTSENESLILTLSPPLMVDPNLASRNNAMAAIAGGGPPVAALPPFERGPEAINAAKDAARKLLGRRIEMAPSAEGELDPLLRDGVTAAQRASAVKGPGSNCGGAADYALAWSLKLPAALPIYPHGHLIEAAGSDRNGCRLRAVRFVTPIEPGEVVDFYYTKARAAGLTAKHNSEEQVHQLAGTKGAAAYAVQARKREDGLTETDLVVNGL